MATKRDFFKINRIYKATRKWNIPLTATDLIRIQEKIKRQYLPKESRIYLRKILTLAFVANKSVFQKSNVFIRNMNQSLTTVKVKGGFHLRSLSSILKMKFSELIKINRHITQYILPIDVKYYDVNIPYSKLKLYNTHKNKMKNNYFVVHIVKKGDTLSSIGNKYKIKYTFIRKFNELKSNSLSLKQKLVIPIIKRGKISRKRATYKVKSGDTLDRIALKYKISLKKIKKDNKLKSNVIKIGDKIEIYK
jgi:membrane-bound lytic murein transglycosylase D